MVNYTCGFAILALALVAIFWKLAFPMFIIAGFYFIWIVFNFPPFLQAIAAGEAAERAKQLVLLPNLLLGIGLAISYSLLLLKDEAYIQKNQMPDNWDIYNIVLCAFVALHAACLIASNVFQKYAWLLSVAYACILFAYIFLFIQYIMGTYFHTDG